jgi:DNA-binding CsgD family transcriptional regulator
MPSVADDADRRAPTPVVRDRALASLPDAVPHADVPADGTVLRGRRRECAALDRLLAGVRAGESQVLVLRGERGIGKTALLECALERASGCRVVRAAGVRSEMELAFAGLHQLCGPLLEHVDRLPVPQRHALGTALGLRSGEAPDRFFLGLAVLGLLREVAAERPLVLLMDDAQWLDETSAQVLGFVARRLEATSVAIVVTVCEGSGEHAFASLPDLVIEGLGDRDARALLGSMIGGRLDEGVRDRIVAETRGNPLALLEVSRGMTPAERAGGFGMHDALLPPGQLEERLLRQLAPLPAATRQLLLLAAAEPLGDPALAWRAAKWLELGVEAAAPAVEAGLIEFGRRVRFRHPLVRSAVYRASSREDRRAVHGALADATDPQTDPDRRAWHRAQATVGPDDGVADELERWAGRAQTRGGRAAAAAFLEQATLLTREPRRRAQRGLAAARAKHDAGAPEAALDMLAAAQAGPLDALQNARVDLLRAQISFAVSGGSDAPALLLNAAKQLEPLDVGLAREAYLEAIAAGIFNGHLGSGGTLAEIAQAARAAPQPLRHPRASDLLLDGLALLITEGHRAATPMLKRSLSAFCAGDDATDGDPRWLALACHIAGLLWDDETWAVLSARQVAAARDAGELTASPLALTSHLGAHLSAGALGAAMAQIQDADMAGDPREGDRAAYGALAVAAFQGREAESCRLIDATTSAVTARGEGTNLTVIQWSAAMLYNGLGRYDKALAAARQAGEHPDQLLFGSWALVELIEAASRSGMTECAAEALERLSETTRASGTDWALGVEARSRALLADGQEAEDLYREAIDRLGRTRAVMFLARTHLLYGEWLRRERRRLDAREQLRLAQDLCTTMGLEAFAQRAAREVLATGETARKRTIGTSGQLTAQEAEIARLASDGLSNPEIGARLFISPRTVEYHLHKVFAKLNIYSRKQLVRALDRAPSRPGMLGAPVGVAQAA